MKGELAVEFGKSNNTIDLLGGYITAGDGAADATMATYWFVAEAHADAQDARYNFTINGEKKVFLMPDICCLCRIGAQMCQGHMQAE